MRPTCFLELRASRRVTDQPRARIVCDAYEHASASGNRRRRHLASSNHESITTTNLTLGTNRCPPNDKRMKYRSFVGGCSSGAAVRLRGEAEPHGRVAQALLSAAQWRRVLGSLRACFQPNKTPACSHTPRALPLSDRRTAQTLLLFFANIKYSIISRTTRRTAGRTG
jgi:hypothetical protein